MRMLREHWNEERGLYVVDESTGEVYEQDELFDLMEEMFTESFGHEPEIEEKNIPLREYMKLALKQKDFYKSPLGQLFGMSELETRTLAYRIKHQRSQEKLEIGEVASKVGVSEEEYTNWEMGESKPTDAQLKKVAWKLGTSVDYLLGEVDESPKFVKFDKEEKENFYQIFRGKLNKLSEQLSSHDITKEKFEKEEKSLLEILSEAPDVEVRGVRIGSYGIVETSSGRSFTFNLENMEQSKN
ncbi:helix-turn-helix transcriptional regulator [Lactococcus lactis]|uniref:helix-turn-helix domain-containing protein n=1 Tax=Lactococcus lactis TaxID=1358 RepID=UPI0024180033|nr:helix-turn-helix transcriptional regulator [Lactococcus lactis]MDG4975085.1 helix-turn-helix transcriptional regulator [Lactococcus lactis]